MSRIVANCREFPANSGQFSTEKLACFEQVATHIRSTLRTPNPEFPPDEYDGEPYCELPGPQPLLFLSL